MTAIVGIVDSKGGKLWMGGDSQSSNSSLSAWNLKQTKVLRVDDFLLGLTGSPRVFQVIQYKLNLEDDPRKDAHEFMCVDFADRMRSILNDSGAKQQKDNVDEVPGWSAVMVGFRGRLFVVHSDFQVAERAEPYESIGCAEDLALGSLWETAKNPKLTPRKRITTALECAENFSCGVRRPFVIKSMAIE